MEFRDMNAPQIVTAIRSKDLSVIRALLREAVVEKKIWSLDDVVEILEAQNITIDRSTVWKWANYVK